MSSPMVDVPPSKRPRQEEQQQQLIPFSPHEKIRTSSLPDPTIKLTGHKGSVYALQYNNGGDALVSASFDMTCLLWMTGGYYTNYNTLQGHKNAILDVKWSNDDECIATASADKTLAWWNANTGVRIKKLQGHLGIVNAVDTIKSGSAPLLASASDDGTLKLWDARTSRGEVETLEHGHAVTAVAYGTTQSLYSGGLDNAIYAWDLRTMKKSMKMTSHTDTITCLSLHPKYETQLLSYSMDSTLKIWDIQPYCERGKRLCKTFTGGKHSAEKGLLKCAWSPDGTMVTGGSADRMVHIWDEVTTQELYLLPGHTGCVNTVVFHPKENVIASGSSDKSIFVGELGQ